ncbi:hypothetical protein VNO77_39314 [Canavalia gladiata]|uniref:Uncharacterized protein n=1 Tax=Canavalia gladiata TaxID=3824 RepID=A0AAN9PY50_CANGL
MVQKKTWSADHPDIPKVLWQLQQLKFSIRYNILLPELRPMDGILRSVLQCSSRIQQLLLGYEIKLDYTKKALRASLTPTWNLLRWSSPSLKINAELSKNQLCSSEPGQCECYNKNSLFVDTEQVLSLDSTTMDASSTFHETGIALENSKKSERGARGRWRRIFSDGERESSEN